MRDFRDKISWKAIFSWDFETRFNIFKEYFVIVLKKYILNLTMDHNFYSLGINVYEALKCMENSI